MEKEEVLKLEYTKINDDYTVATITYQNEDVLKRSHFNDTELNILSFMMPCLNDTTLFIKGSSFKCDNRPIIIPNENVKFVKEKVKKLNEKYGIPKKWCPKIDDKYYYISLGATTNINYNVWDNTLYENLCLEKNLIFKTKEEAHFVANKMLENIDKWREEYQKENKNE